MQLCTTANANIYRVYFNELETNNIIKSLNGKVGIKNINLCYFIEEMLPKLFKECRNKRVMVTKILKDKYICAIVLLQNVTLKFSKPKDNVYLFRVTEISFNSETDFKNWLQNKKYNYIINSKSSRNIRVIVFNMSIQDEMMLSQNNGKIDVACSAFEYLLILISKRIRDKFKLV